MSKYDFPTQFVYRKTKSEKRKTKSEKRKRKSEKRKTKSEKRKAKNEKRKAKKRKSNQLHLAYVDGLKYVKKQNKTTTTFFIVLFYGLICYCIIVWTNLGISGKLILFFYISFWRPEVLKITAKIGVGLDI